MGQALARADVTHEIVIYPRAGHGFLCERRDSYDEPAATDAWRRITQLLTDQVEGQAGLWRRPDRHRAAAGSPGSQPAPGEAW